MTACLGLLPSILGIFRTKYIPDIELFKYHHNLVSVDLEWSLASPQAGHMANIKLNCTSCRRPGTLQGWVRATLQARDLRLLFHRTSRRLSFPLTYPRLQQCVVSLLACRWDTFRNSFLLYCMRVMVQCPCRPHISKTKHLVARIWNSEAITTFLLVALFLLVSVSERVYSSVVPLFRSVCFHEAEWQPWFCCEPCLLSDFQAPRAEIWKEPQIPATGGPNTDTISHISVQMASDPN